MLPRRTISLSRGDVAYVDHGDGDGDAAGRAVRPRRARQCGHLAQRDLGASPACAAASPPTCRRTAATPVPDGEAPTCRCTGWPPCSRSCASGLGLTQVDVVANDTGGAVAQVFAARYPGRIRTLTLTNCDVHDNFPPEAFKPFVELAESGEFGPMVAAMAGDLALARSEVGFGMGYAHPDQLSDEVLRSYLEPFVADQGKGLERLLTASSAAELMAVEPLLGRAARPGPGGLGHRRLVLRAGVGRAAGEHDPRRRARRARPDAMLFWPDERAPTRCPPA